MIDRIAIICPAMGGAGAVANVALHQAIELAKRFHVTLVSESFPASLPGGLTCHYLKPPRFGLLRRFAHVPNEIAFAVAARKAIGRLHASEGVGLVICHGHAVATLAARGLQRGYGIPYALVTHGDIFDRPKGTYDPRLTWFYRRMTPAAYRQANLVVALSPHMASLAIRGGARPERVRLIPNGIDPADIGIGADAPPIYKAATGVLELLFVGRLSVEKGVDVLIGAAALLRERGVKFHLKIVGSGADEKVLRSQVAELDLDKITEFIGSRPRKELGKIYQAADIVCVPSRSDPLPTVVLEAMAAGVTVVGTNVGGIPFMVKHGRTGRVCEADSCAALADALEEFVKTAELLGSMGKAGKQFADSEFDWRRIGDVLVAAIENIRPQEK